MTDVRPAGGRRTLSTVLAVTLFLSLLWFAGPAQAEEPLERRNEVRIASDTAWTPANGVRSGSGTAHDPYVISGWDVPRVHISDTDKYFVIRDNSIGTLTLNWNGPRALVVNNRVQDLRVNQNVKRTGAATSGRITNNVFGFVGQLRHFDGVFAKNTVGSATQNSIEFPFFGGPIVTFDGFNGARFRDNKIFGPVDVKLHGHHHGSSFGDSSHHHSGGHHHDAPGTDHSRRFHEVWISGNEIHVDQGWALRYNDVGHAGNDRTASSESNPELNKPHEHFTKIHLTDNKLVGGGLVVDIFNADDHNHRSIGQGSLEIARNDITVQRQDDRDLVWDRLDGIAVLDAQSAKIEIVRNKVRTRGGSSLPAQDLVGGDAGIRVDGMRNADIRIISNSVAGLGYGVWAGRFGQNVTWLVHDLETTQVAKPVDGDGSAPPPRQRP